MDRFVLTQKLHKKLDVTTVEHCAYYIKRILKSQGQIVKGYCHVIDSSEKLVYYWVEDSGGNRYDVAFAVASYFTPEVKNLQYILKTEEPSEFQTDAKNEEMYTLYKENPKEFWSKIKL
jgi:hypothetical protein